jgi:hypothetical protein
MAFELVAETVFQTEEIELALLGALGTNEFNENEHDDREREADERSVSDGGSVFAVKFKTKAFDEEKIGKEMNDVGEIETTDGDGGTQDEGVFGAGANETSQ